MTQGELRHLTGSVVRPPHRHEAHEIAICRNKMDAAYLSLKHCGMDQDDIAARMPMDPGHLSRLIRGTRPWSDRWQERFEAITGSLALTQWDCKARGGELYIDPKQQRIAILENELQREREAA